MLVKSPKQSLGDLLFLLLFFFWSAERKVKEEKERRIIIRRRKGAKTNWKVEISYINVDNF
jgi:hypothetical protein